MTEFEELIRNLSSYMGMIHRQPLYLQVNYLTFPLVLLGSHFSSQTLFIYLETSQCPALSTSPLGST